jgi:hypothetical protein
VPQGAGGGNAEEIKKRVFRCWRQVRWEGPGWATEDPRELYGYEYAPDGWRAWLRRGELSAGTKDKGSKIIVDPTADPRRIDFHDTIQGSVWVTPCIFRFEEGKLIIIEPTAPGAQQYRKDGRYSNRPTSFTCTKENKYQKKVLVECRLYDQD